MTKGVWIRRSSDALYFFFVNFQLNIEMDHLAQSKRRSDCTADEVVGNPSETETEIGEMDHLVQSEKGNPREIATQNEEMDRISQLPEFIVHRILSFLHVPHVEIVRMSVLSKTWFHLTACFPVLDFNILYFEPQRHNFFKYVEYTTSRYCHHNLTAHTFKLVTTLQEPADLDIVYRCVDLVLNKGVQELMIFVMNPLNRFRLPDTLLSVSMLKSLIIESCELPSSLMADVVRFKSLIRLELANVPIDDEAIKYLATSCPLLQEFHIHTCYGFKRFCIYGHQNLKKVVISGKTQVERIDIDAPNLSTLSFGDTYRIEAPLVNLASCKKLTTVTYCGNPLPNSYGFIGFLSNFPFIENLILVTKYKCNNLKWSSRSLRILVLRSDCDLEEIEFSAPNLALFIYACDYNLLWPIIMNERWLRLRDSPYLKSCMQCYPGHIGALWFQKLRRFLDKENGYKVLNLYIRATCSQELTELEKLKAIELPPYELEHLELQLDELSAHVAFVDALLWCCRPRSLALRSFFNLPAFEKQSNVIKFTYKKLLEQEDEGHTRIQIVWSSSSEAQKQLRDLKSLSMATPRGGNTVTFLKEEVFQEEAG
ncbi:hypothetical protein QVD17_06281 [Tagetes erecta]|uniref:F-box/LRR-repeat protein 15/At3g58940/PEG3-like LRR domain-containing protein n=1 Tax=Tagetes erecta TaxID=13708 RepID=A0AAD8LGL9_TARER|nr:hypothetical protein QVD17_06281 [Tagetes erecta]